MLMLVFNSYAQWSFKMLAVIKQAADSSSWSKVVCAVFINVVNINIFSGMPSSSLRVGCPPLFCFSLWVKGLGSRLRQSPSGAAFPKTSCKINIREDTEKFLSYLAVPTCFDLQ